MCKVLVITSSFRKNGNTDILADQFAMGARENGNDVEVIHLRDYKLNFCMGCYACVKLGKCIQKDDFNDIFPKMMEADAICFSSNEVLEAIETRRSIRRFKEEQIKDDELETVLKAGTWAPTGMGKQDPFIVAV